MINLVTALYHFLSLVVPIGKKATLPAIAATPAPSGPRLLRQCVCHQTTTLRATPAPFPAYDGYWAGYCQELLPSSRPAWAGAQGQKGIGSPCALPQISLIS